MMTIFSGVGFVLIMTEEMKGSIQRISNPGDLVAGLGQLSDAANGTNSYYLISLLDMVITVWITIMHVIPVCCGVFLFCQHYCDLP